ncbi:uncharacterized protein LOC120842197 [Ixodes scapularis]|uniref:uncharacterized protein LOC120842197 n=1 Tax=Ixodes scapularis TaxID=6945 RepID=UPI001C38B0A3|nr:uncharacterized protein LOC120842197 [Ixodes scapularis]
MISFSMVLWWFSRKDFSQGFGLGTPCIRAYSSTITKVCRSNYNYAGNPTKHPTYTRLGSHDVTNLAVTYDGPDEIEWKICSATRQFPNIAIGMALFNLESEDTREDCKSTYFGYFQFAAGYWRVSQVTDYFRKTVKHPNFTQSGPMCKEP